MICSNPLIPGGTATAVISKWESKATTSSSSALGLKKTDTSVLINAILGEKENDDLKYEVVKNAAKLQQES